MTLMTENLLFLDALLAHIDRLRALLGAGWPAFQTRLQEQIERLIRAENDRQIIDAVDEIFAAGLATPADSLFRSLMEQAARAAGSFSETTRSVRMLDPTSGQARDVAITQQTIAAAGR